MMDGTNRQYKISIESYSANSFGTSQACSFRHKMVDAAACFANRNAL